MYVHIKTYHVNTVHQLLSCSLVSLHNHFEIVKSDGTAVVEQDSFISGIEAHNSCLVWYVCRACHGNFTVRRLSFAASLLLRVLDFAIAFVVALLLLCSDFPTGFKKYKV